jgi:hypothetical protein
MAVCGAGKGFATVGGGLIGDGRADFGPDSRLGVWRSEKRLGQPRIPARWTSEISLPAAERSRIDAEEPGEGCLGETPFLPEREQALANGCSSGPRRVAKEPHDGWQEVECWRRSVQLPVGDRRRADPEALGELALEETEVEPPLAKVISQSCKGLRVGMG